jgi:hypothetical protein
MQILCIFSQKEGHFRPSYYKLALFLWIYIPIETCCHYQFCFALQMRQSSISSEQKQNLSLN